MVEMQLWPREEVFTVMAAFEVFKFMMLGIDRRCFINDGNNIWQPLSLTQNHPRVYQLLQIVQSVVFSPPTPSFRFQSGIFNCFAAAADSAVEESHRFVILYNMVD
jgi:hypothetical protein